MFRSFIRLALPALVFFCFVSAQFPQDCKTPEIVFNRDTGNIFTEEQEMHLGDAIAEQVQRDFRILSDREISAYLEKIGDRLIRHLPPTSLKFRFAVVDIPDVNAFAMPGGRIFVTRKLIAFVRSEDELAGILAHELGHGIVRHGAQDLSKVFKEVLKVDSFGDRADVFAKYNELLDKQNTKRVRTSRSHEGDQQLEADRIGVFAMTAAGYNPDAFTSAFDRLFETEGKTGSWFSDLFGSTTPEQKRLREITDAVKLMPRDCIERGSVGTADDFADWQTAVIAISTVSGEENVSHLVRKKSLAPRLRDQIRHLKFSPDGKHVLAQDESSVFVLQTSPFKYLFSIDAPEALDATFSPDSTKIVLSTENLRVERWDIASGEPEMIREVYNRQECIQSALSDDGRTLVCFYRNVNRGQLFIDVKLIDVESNSVIFEHEKFFRPDPFDYIFFQLLNAADIAGNGEMFQTAFSPNGRYFVAGRVFKNAYRGFSLTAGIRGSAVVRAGKTGILGFDLVAKEEIKIGSDLRDIISSPFAFHSNDLIIGQDSEDGEKSGIYEFPSGKQVERFELLADSLTKPYLGNYVLVRPIKVAPVGVYDLSAKKFVIANNNSALDVYGNMFVSENKDGELGLFRLDRDETIGTIELPESRFGGIRALDVSPDLNFLAVSNRERGAVWSLFSGDRMFYVPPFSSAYFDKTGKIYADFTGSKESARQLGVMDIPSKQLQPGRAIPQRTATQHGEYLVTLDAEKSGSTTRVDVPTDIRSGTRIYSERVDLDRIFQVRDVKSNDVIWERTFEKTMPRAYFSALNDTISFVWSVNSDGAKEIFKEDKALKDKADSLGDKDGDYFIQIVESATGKVLGNVFIESGEGSFRVLEAEASGDYLAIADSENRIHIYSLSTGELASRYFGRNFALNKENGTVAVGNNSGGLAVYEIATGRTLERMSFTSPIAYAQYGKYGKKLLVLTADQDVFILDCTKFGTE
ncbi:MAG: M48 family metalloprotease [Acidobacteriota bacterium]|nr:MAG: M48 family metalloprotease [Acidobacteriota bacterium]